MENRFKEVRIDSGLSMRAFSERIGVSHSTISLIESGQRNVTKQMAKVICGEFNINDEWFWTGKGEMHGPVSKNQKYAEIAARLKVEDDDLKTALCDYIANADASQLKAALYELVVFLRKSGIDFEL